MNVQVMVGLDEGMEERDNAQGRAGDLITVTKQITSKGYKGRETGPSIFEDSGTKTRSGVCLSEAEAGLLPTRT